MIIECILLSASLCRAVRSKPIVTLASVQTAALVADGVTTRQYESRGDVEDDPVAKFILGDRPTWARMAPAGAVLVIGEMWLAERMKTSRHAWERKTWWLPMVLGTAANTYEAVHNSSLP